MKRTLGLGGRTWLGTGTSPEISVTRARAHASLLSWTGAQNSDIRPAVSSGSNYAGRPVNLSGSGGFQPGLVVVG